jgi:hypothetical protein
MPKVSGQPFYFRSFVDLRFSAVPSSGGHSCRPKCCLLMSSISKSPVRVCSDLVSRLIHDPFVESSILTSYCYYVAYFTNVIGAVFLRVLNL